MTLVALSSSAVAGCGFSLLLFSVALPVHLHLPALLRCESILGLVSGWLVVLGILQSLAVLHPSIICVDL